MKNYRILVKGFTSSAVKIATDMLCRRLEKQKHSVLAKTRMQGLKIKEN